MAEFWVCRGESNVLLVPFEELIDDLSGNIPPIAKFMGLEAPDQAVAAKVAELASLSYMSEHDDQFSEGW